MAIKLGVFTCEEVELTWDSSNRREMFKGSSGRVHPSAINYLEMAISVCVGRGITAYFVKGGVHGSAEEFKDAVKNFGNIVVDIAENKVKEDPDDVDWIVNIVCTTTSQECADILTGICEECTVLKMLQADVALNFVNNPYPVENTVSKVSGVIEENSV